MNWRRNSTCSLMSYSSLSPDPPQSTGQSCLRRPCRFAFMVTVHVHSMSKSRPITRPARFGMAWDSSCTGGAVNDCASLHMPAADIGATPKSWCFYARKAHWPSRHSCCDKAFSHDTCSKQDATAHHLHLLYSRVGAPLCPCCQEPASCHSLAQSLACLSLHPQLPD